MNLYIPYGYTPYGGNSNYGVFSTRELAEEELREQKKHGYHEDYYIQVLQLDRPEVF